MSEHDRGKIIIKYYGIYFDSNFDESRTEQISKIIRHVHVEDDIVKNRESFLDCYLISEKTSQNMTYCIVYPTRLWQCGINVRCTWRSTARKEKVKIKKISIPVLIIP